MIIVEGPDGSGKSTLIKRLVDHWHLPVADRVVGKDTKATLDVAAWTEDNVLRGWQPIIFDRHRLISEPIYGPLLRGMDQDPHFLLPVWVSVQLQRFYESQPLIIFCLPPLEQVYHNVRHDGSNDNSAVADKIVPIYSAYVARAALEATLRPRATTVYDYTTDGKEEDPLACFYRWDKIISARRHW